MKIICAWCGGYRGEKEPLDDHEITHTICKGCTEELMAERRHREQVSNAGVAAEVAK